MPHRCRKRVSPCMQQRRNVVGLVSPMPQVCAARPSARLFPVHIQNELVVRADVHHEMRHGPLQLQHLPKPQHHAVTLSYARSRNPLRSPVFFGRIPLALPEGAALHENARGTHHRNCHPHRQCSERMKKRAACTAALPFECGPPFTSGRSLFFPLLRPTDHFFPAAYFSAPKK